MCGQAFDGGVAALAERIRQLPHARVLPQKNLLDFGGLYVRPPRFMQVDGAVGTIWDFTPPAPDGMQNEPEDWHEVYEQSRSSRCGSHAFRS